VDAQSVMNWTVDRWSTAVVYRTDLRVYGTMPSRRVGLSAAAAGRLIITRCDSFPVIAAK